MTWDSSPISTRHSKSMTPKYPMTNKNTLMMNCPNLIKPFKANLGKLMNPDLIRRSHNIDANVKFFFILKSAKFVN